ncbi:MAG: transcription elongation factor GreB [Marinobacter sp.]|uniref:transcription elongation factor GreB n=1 Tax=Marinobacter sp. TaxID=50741 RepID=UPI00349FDE7F
MVDAPQIPRGRARYITPDGEQALRKELTYLWKEKRPEVTQSVREAAAQGDRSENAEYIYGKKQLREIDRRIRFLTKRLDELTVVTRTPDDTGRVYFGAWVTVENEAGEEQRYRLVGPDEFDLSKGYLSVDAPLARALLGKRCDDEVTVRTPDGIVRWEITDIHYDPIQATEQHPGNT